jgi:O-antigen/teichoic acid export membrane protein
MAESLKNSAISGAKWNAVLNIGRYFISFFLSIILARLLDPSEFGLIGMLNIFTAIALVFINAGFTSALIRENKSIQADFSTIFYYNIFISIIFYLLLFFAAPLIADFYKEQKLIVLTRLISLVFLINSLGIVQNAILIRDLNFKSQTICNLVGLGISVIVSIIMAFKGYGVYSIVAQAITQAFVTNLLFWIYSDWRPKGGFNKESFKRLWKFASQILATNIIAKIVENIDNLLIGKVFSATDLGYYVRAKSTKQLPEQIFGGILSTTAFAVLSKVNQNKEEFKRLHLKFFDLCVYGFFPIAFGLIGVSKSFTILLYSEKWVPSVPLLQVIAISSIPIFIGTLFTQTIMSQGNGKLYFRLNTIKKLIGLLSIPFGIFLGLYPFLIAFLVISLIGLFLDIYYTSKLLLIPIKQYLLKMYLPFLMSVIMCLCVLASTKLPIQNQLLSLIIQLTVGFIVYTLLSLIFKVKEFWIYKSIVIEQLKSIQARIIKR